MAKNIELVRQEVAAMRNEVEDFANSAERVGGVVSDVLEYSHEEKERAQAAEANITAAVAQNAGDINGLKDNSATKGELNAEAERAQAAEEVLTQQVNSNFDAFSKLGVEESAKMDGYEIALTKKTNTAEKTKVKVPVYDMQNPSATPVGLVDEIFVEDMKAEAKKMVDAEAERAEAKEQELSGDLATEAERAKSAEGSIMAKALDNAGRITALETASATKAELSAEAERASNAEKNIATLVQKNAGDIKILEDVSATKAELSAEAERAEAKEQEIEGKVAELESELIFDVNAYKGDYTPFSSRGDARASAPYSKIGKKGLILKYLTTEGWVVEMQITDNYSSQDNGWATIYNGNDERMRDMATDMFGLVSMPLFQVIGNTLKIYNDFNVFSSTRVSPYKTIPAQELTLPNNTYWSACLVFDINNKQFETSLKVFSLIPSSTFTNPKKEDGKLYIPILWCLSNSNKIESRQDIRSFYPQAKPIYNTPTALATSPYRGVYLPSGKINRVLVNVVDTTTDLSFYKLNLKTKQIELIKTFASTSLVKGLQMLDFDTSVVVGGENQIVFSGKVGYKFIDEMEITSYSYYPETKKIEFSHNTTLLLGLVYVYTDMYDATSEYPKMMDLILQGESISSIPTPTDINNCTSELSNVGYVGQLVGGDIKVASIDVNVRNTSIDIKVISYNTKTREIVELKKVTPTSVGILNIPFDTPIVMGEVQILVHGGIGFNYDGNNFGGNFNGANISYNYSGNGIYECSKVNMVAWGIRYNMYESISLADYMQNLAIDFYSRLSVNSEVIIEAINIQDYDNNLRKVFAAITPSEKHRYVVEIPEGTYDVKSWFTDDEIAMEESRFMGGLQVPNYVKLLGVGARDKIVLKWDNSSNAHYDQISTLNMKDWNELENLTIVGNNVRYAVHDDYQASKAARHLRVVNCDFQITDGSRSWGAGHNGGYDGEFINCKFSLFRGTGYVQSYTYIEPFVLHDNTDSVGDSKVLFENCRFYNEYADNPCLAFGMSANENRDITRAVVNGCKMNTYLKMYGDDTICTGRVTGYANVMGSAPQIEGAEQGEDIVDILWSQL